MAFFLWCYLSFVLLRFCLHDFVEAAALRSIVLRYGGALFSFCVFRDAAFSEYFCTIVVLFLYGEYVVRSFLPDDVFLPCDHGLDFLHQLIM